MIPRRASFVFLWKIEGTVVDPAGAPVAGASVALTCPGGGPQTIVTAADGRFAFGPA